MSQAKVDFSIAFRHLMGWEDANNSGAITSDTGGKTKYGVSHAAYPSLDIKSLTLVNAYKLYQTDFWYSKQWNIPEWTNQDAANKFLQVAVNLGISVARQFGIIAQFFMYDNAATFKYVPSMPFRFYPVIYQADPDKDYRELIDIVGAMQLSRYMRDYHILANVPSQLVARATSIGAEIGWRILPKELQNLNVLETT